MTKVNAEEGTEIAVSGGSYIITASDLSKCATPRMTLSQTKYLVSSVGSHKVKSFIPP
jgi:hypothetical protein